MNRSLLCLGALALGILLPSFGYAKIKWDAQHKCKKRANEVYVTFPGDKCPKKPDFIIAGAGTTSLPLAYSLSNQGYRVLMIEQGKDESDNPMIQNPFGTSRYLGDGPVLLNVNNAILDPNITTFMGNTEQGYGFRVEPVISGSGVGGGGLHWYLLDVRPTPTILDGPLPSQMVPPVNTSTYSFVEAGGPKWSSARIESIISNHIENFRQIGGANGLTEYPSERGYNGPEMVLQLQPFPPSGEAAVVQDSFAAAATTLLGGAASPIVMDYNVPQNINCTSQDQFFLNQTFNRQNSATSWADSTIVAPDGDGNLVGVNGRKLVIWTSRAVTRAIEDEKRSKPGSYVASGVEFLYKNSVYYVAGKNVVCSMGAGFSPLFWQRSGIGPVDVLNKIDVPVKVESPFVGRNLANQYGASILLSTANPNYENGLYGITFLQYNNCERRFQVFQAGLGSTMLLVIENMVYPLQPGRHYFFLLGFICEPRSRGYVESTTADYGGQPIIRWNYFSDGPVPSDPASGLVDPDSDISASCAMLDYLYQSFLNMQANQLPGDDIQLEYPPLELFTPGSPAERYPQMVPYLMFSSKAGAHESSSVVMNNDPAKGACDGNLKMHGTANCFQVDASIAPVMNSGQPGTLEQAIGYNAGLLIPMVARR